MANECEDENRCDWTRADVGKRLSTALNLWEPFRLFVWAIICLCSHDKLPKQRALKAATAAKYATETATQKPKERLPKKMRMSGWAEGAERKTGGRPPKRKTPGQDVGNLSIFIISAQQRRTSFDANLLIYGLISCRQKQIKIKINTNKGDKGNKRSHQKINIMRDKGEWPCCIDIIIINLIRRGLEQISGCAWAWAGVLANFIKHQRTSISCNICKCQGQKPSTKILAQLLIMLYEYYPFWIHFHEPRSAPLCVCVTLHKSRPKHGTKNLHSQGCERNL